MPDPGLQRLPAEVVGQLGVDKQDAHDKGALDLNTQVPAGEYNVLKHAVYELCQAVGLFDASTIQSLSAVLLRGFAPARTLRANQIAPEYASPFVDALKPEVLGAFAIVDDFSDFETETWDTYQVSGGALSYGDASVPGMASFEATSSGAKAHVADHVKFIRAGHFPVLQARIKLPASLADSSAIVGFGSAVSGVFTDQVTMSATTTGWRCIVEDSDSVFENSVNGTAPTPGGWHTIKIEAGGGVEGLVSECRFYVDGSLIHTIQSGISAPVQLKRFVGLDYVANSGGILMLDWLDLRMNRVSIG